MDDLMSQLRSPHTECRQKCLTLIIVLEGWAAAGKGKIPKKLAKKKLGGAKQVMMHCNGV